MISDNNDITLGFIAGGGEMGQYMREKNWAQTPVGSPDGWPQSLRTTISIVLNSPFPMMLLWGKELLCFYNDAYKASLGKEGKHPAMLGARADEHFKEMWNIVFPQIQQVYSQGISTLQEDTLVPIYRNGAIENVYWTYSYSPVKDESGSIAGVFVLCAETTGKVISLQKITASERNFRNLINEAPVAAAIFIGPDYTIEVANDEALKLWRKDRQVVGRKLLEALPELKDQPFMDILYTVYTTGQTYEGKSELAWLEKEGKLQPVYVNFIYKALHNDAGNIYGILTIGYDVTVEAQAKTRLQETEERMRLAIDAGNFGTFDVDLTTNTVEYSKTLWSIFGVEGNSGDRSQFINALLPEYLEVRKAAYDKLTETGHLFYEARLRWPDGSLHWISAQGKHLYNEEGKAIRLIGVVKNIDFGKEIEINLRKSEERFRQTVMQAPIGITILRGPQMIVEMANTTYLELVDREEDNFVGKSLFDSLPEVKPAVEPLLTDILRTGIPYYGYDFEVDLVRHGKKEKAYFNFVYHPLLEDDKTVSGIIVVATDVTSQIVARNNLAESERQFRNLVLQSPIPMAIFRGPEFVIEVANIVLLDTLWRRSFNEVQGRKLLDVFPELRGQKYPQLLEEVLTTGIAHKQKESVAYVDGPDGMKRFYLDFEYAPLFEIDRSISGVIITVNNVTEQVEARQQLKDAADRLQLATEGSQIGTWDLDLATHNIIHSPRLALIFGFEEGVQLIHPAIRAQILEEDRPIVEKAFALALKTGLYNYEARIAQANGEIRWIKTLGKVIFDEKQQPVRMLGTVSDITDRKLAHEGRERLAAIVDSSGDAIISKRLDGTITSWNEAAQRIFGYEAAEMVGQSIYKLIPPELYPEEGVIIAQIREGERVDHYETQRLRKDGRRIDVSLTVSPLKDQQGNIVGASKIARDVTEQKMVEQMMQDSERRYRFLADSMPLLVWTAPPSGILDYFNKAVYDYSGLNPKQLFEKGWLEIVHPDDRKENIERWTYSVKTGEQFLFEHRFKRHDGMYRWYLSRAVAQKDLDGNIQMWVGASADIHDRKLITDNLETMVAQRTEELYRLNEDLQKSNTELAQFAYVASHDLQEPLRKIQTFTTRLLDIEKDNLSDKGRDYFSRMEVAARRMQQLIVDLLTYSRTSSGDSLYELIDLNLLLETIVDQIKDTIEQKQVSIKLKGLPVMNVIRYQMEQLFTNLIGNAIKFSREGVPAIIKIECEKVKAENIDAPGLQAKKYYHISVADNGIGFDQQFNERIFQVFQRLHGKEEYAGTGIGLAICKKIVENHSGFLLAEGKPGEGAVFHVYLPAEE